MNTPRHILVVVERNDAALQAFNKACTLARHTGGRIELFLCDAERGYSLRHSYDQHGSERAASLIVDDARRYLQALRRSVITTDLEIGIDASCETPEYEGIVHKVLATCPDLVIKGIGGGPGETDGGPSLNDWHLARTCPVPLLLTRRRAWSARPRIAASLDLLDRESPELTSCVADAAASFAVDFHGELHLLFGALDPPADALAPVARQFGVPLEHVHLLAGDPVEQLPRHAAEQRYDVIALGALGHRRDPATLVGSLTDAMMQAVDSDFLLLKPGSYTCPVPARADLGSSGESLRTTAA